MKKTSLIFLAMFTMWINAHSQCHNINPDLQSYTGTITDPGINPANAWINDNLNNWSAAHGSPDVSTTAGNNAFHMFSLSPTNGEGVYTDHVFVNGLTYTLTYDLYLFGSADPTKHFLATLTNGLNPNYDIADFSVPTPATQVIVSNQSWGTTGSWITVSETFVVPATGTFEQLWLRPLHDSGGGVALCRVDNICLFGKKLGDPCSVKPAFHVAANKCQYQFSNASLFEFGTSLITLDVSWDFGDGTSASGEVVNHYYSSPGTYTVCMSIWTTDGSVCCKQVICKKIEITSVCKPCEIMEWDGLTVEATDIGALTQSFSLTGLPAAMTAIYGYYWNYGDGSIGTGITPAHTYESPGTYDVCLTLFYPNPSGEKACCKKVICTTITILSPSLMAPATVPSGNDGTQIIDQTEELNDRLEIYPNPNNGAFNLVTVNGTFINSIQVFDQAGKSVKQISLSSPARSTSINISNLDKGIYFVIVNEHDESLRMFSKVILE